MYTRSMETPYLSLRAQVAVDTFFMKSPVWFSLLVVHNLLNSNKIYKFEEKKKITVLLFALIV